VQTRVIGLHPARTPSVEQIMMLASYHHGPHAVDQFVDWWPHSGEAHDLTTAEGRLRESIELLVAAQQLPDTEAIRKSVLKRTAIALNLRSKAFRTRTPRAIFGENIARMLDETVWTTADSHDSTSKTEAGMTPPAPEAGSQLRFV
jgi:hypothetical protein